MRLSSFAAFARSAAACSCNFLRCAGSSSASGVDHEVLDLFGVVAFLYRVHPLLHQPRAAFVRLTT